LVPNRFIRRFFSFLNIRSTERVKEGSDQLNHIITIAFFSAGKNVLRGWHAASVRRTRRKKVWSLLDRFLNLGKKVLACFVLIQRWHIFLSMGKNTPRYFICDHKITIQNFHDKGTYSNFFPIQRLPNYIKLAFLV
jgi:hypothetical protein